MVQSRRLWQSMLSVCKQVGEQRCRWFSNEKTSVWWPTRFLPCWQVLISLPLSVCLCFSMIAFTTDANKTWTAHVIFWVSWGVYIIQQHRRMLVLVAWIGSCCILCFAGFRSMAHSPVTNGCAMDLKPLVSVRWFKVKFPNRVTLLFVISGTPEWPFC